MVPTSIIETPRLLLRTWLEDDIEPLAKINSDPKVMTYFPDILSKEQSQQLYNKICHHYHAFGYTLYAVSLKPNSLCIGFIGLINVSFSATFTPAIEIGWRLAHRHWGLGLATEGASAVLHYVFSTLNLQEIVSFTSTNNYRSQRVMQKIGLIAQPNETFKHPNLPCDSPLSEHVLYRRTKNI